MTAVVDARGLDAVAQAGLVYDLLIRAGGLAAATATVAEHDALQFVLDHAAKPPIASGDLELWRRDIDELARHSNVAVKLSRLVTEADWQAWSTDDLRPVADHLLATFGPGRVACGTASYDAASSHTGQSDSNMRLHALEVMRCRQSRRVGRRNGELGSRTVDSTWFQLPISSV